MYVLLQAATAKRKNSHKMIFVKTFKWLIYLVIRKKKHIVKLFQRNSPLQS